MYELLELIQDHEILKTLEIVTEDGGYFLYEDGAMFEENKAIETIKLSYPPNDVYAQIDASSDLEFDIRSLIFDTRLFCGLKPKRKSSVKRREIPVELIEKILLLAHFDDEICYEHQVKVMIRCLLDRRTLGKIPLQEMKPSKNFMYVRCRNILESLLN